jgi:hypothetical protein
MTRDELGESKSGSHKTALSHHMNNPMNATANSAATANFPPPVGVDVRMARDAATLYLASDLTPLFVPLGKYRVTRCSSRAVWAGEDWIED